MVRAIREVRVPTSPQSVHQHPLFNPLQMRPSRELPSETGSRLAQKGDSVRISTSFPAGVSDWCDQTGRYASHLGRKSTHFVQEKESFWTPFRGAYRSVFLQKRAQKGVILEQVDVICRASEIFYRRYGSAHLLETDRLNSVWIT